MVFDFDLDVFSGAVVVSVLFGLVAGVALGLFALGAILGTGLEAAFFPDKVVSVFCLVCFCSYSESSESSPDDSA